jgi:NAD(P)-dependent dehydrogenase (short-subunit alcohol dehydrogenase family)
MKTALITGANKGIGFETAKQLAQRGFYVYLGSRTLSAGQVAVEKLKASGINSIETIQLDVTDQDSVSAAAAYMAEKMQALDVLINNAGISGGVPQSALGSTAEEFRTVYETNVFGVARVTQAFIELLKKAPEPRIVNLSTAMASHTLAADVSGYTYDNKLAIYQSSKAALNMYTVNLAYELRNTTFKINMVCPGWTQTDFTGYQGTSTAEEAGARIAKYAMIGQDGPSGKFISEEYYAEPASCPW